MLKNIIWMGRFYSKSVSYVTVDLGKLVGDLFHVGSTLAGKKCIQREMRL